MRVSATFTLAIKGLDSQEFGKLDEFSFNHSVEGEYTTEELTTTMSTLLDLCKTALKLDLPEEEETYHEAT